MVTLNDIEIKVLVEDKAPEKLKEKTEVRQAHPLSYIVSI